MRQLLPALLFLLSIALATADESPPPQPTPPESAPGEATPPAPPPTKAEPAAAAPQPAENPTPEVVEPPAPETASEPTPPPSMVTAPDPRTGNPPEAPSGPVEAQPEAAPADAAGAMPAESMASRELRKVMDRENIIWARLKANPDDELEKKRAETDFRDVVTAYENVLRLSPDYAEAWAAYGLLLSRTGNRESALLAFMKANKINPEIPMVKNQIGNQLFEDGEYMAALPYYLAAVDLAPNEPLYHYNLGSLLFEYRDFYVADGLYVRSVLDRKMQAAFRRAAGLAPDNWAYAYRYGESFYDVEEPDWPAALAVWETLEKANKPGSVEAQTVRLQRANVLIKLGRTDEARTLLKTVTDPALAQNKQTLVDQLDGKRKE